MWYHIWKKWVKLVNMKKRKHKFSFIQFDMSSYYTSISLILLNNALSFARNFFSISRSDIQIILNARKTLIEYDNQNRNWQRTDSANLFDITMRSFLLGSGHWFSGTIPSDTNRAGSLRSLIGGLYRDDALLAVQDCSKTRLCRLEKSIRKFLKDLCLEIIFDVNHRVVNYLDTTLNLDTWLYCPYLKPGKIIHYINAHSNHPRSTIMGVVIAISVRVSNLSANRCIFEHYALTYNYALKLSGFRDEIYYIDNTKFKTLLYDSGSLSDPCVASNRCPDRSPNSRATNLSYSNLDSCRYNCWNNFKYFNTRFNDRGTHLD